MPYLGDKVMFLLQVMQIDTIHAAAEMQFLPMMNVSQYWSGKLGLGSKPGSAMLVSTLSFGLSLDPSCLGKHIFTVPPLSGQVRNILPVTLSCFLEAWLLVSHAPQSYEQ